VRKEASRKVVSRREVRKRVENRKVERTTINRGLSHWFIIINLNQIRCNPEGSCRVSQF
jgi:hypothetical protein